MIEISHFRSFNHRDYRYAWASNALGGASAWTFLIASQWYVLADSDRSGLVGLFTFASMLPFLLISPFAGILSDRFERKNLTLLTMAGGFIVIATATALAITGVLELWQLCILAFLSGSFRATQEVALVSLVTNIVPPKDLLNAITLNSAIRHGSRVIGMCVLLSSSVPSIDNYSTSQFLFASAVFGAASLIAISIVKTKSIGEPEPSTGMIQGILDGMKFIYSNRPVGVFIILVSFHCALVMSFDSILPVLSRDTLGSNDEFLLALLVLAFGSGSVIGTFLIAGIQNDKRKGTLFLVSGVISALSLVGLGISSEIFPSFIAKFLMGASQSSFMALSMTYVQILAPDEMRGRISSLYILHAGGIMAFANLGYGNLADLFGATEILVVTGLIFFIAYISISLVDPILRRVYRGDFISLSTT